MITINSTVEKQVSNFIESEFGEEIMLMNLETGNYLHVNQMGKVIWQYLDGATNIQNLCDDLLKSYDIDKATCERDVLEFLNNLLENSIITVH